MTTNIGTGMFYAPYIPNLEVIIWWKDLPYIEYTPAIILNMSNKKLDAMVFCIKLDVVFVT